MIRVNICDTLLKVPGTEKVLNKYFLLISTGDWFFSLTKDYIISVLFSLLSFFIFQKPIPNFHEFCEEQLNEITSNHFEMHKALCKWKVE